MIVGLGFVLSVGCLYGCLLVLSLFDWWVVGFNGLFSCLGYLFVYTIWVLWLIVVV